MNFESPEIQNALKEIEGKLVDGFDMNQLTSAGSLPSLSDFAEKAKGLLPENLSKIAPDGKIVMPTFTDLKQSLSNGLNNIKGELEKEITSKMDAIKGEANAIIQDGQEVFSQMQDASTNLQKNASLATNKALETLNGTINLKIDSESIGKVYNSATNTIDGFLTLSPKKLKELSSNTDYYDQLKKAALEASITKSGLTAQLNTQESLINQQLENSAYRDLFGSAISSSKMGNIFKNLGGNDKDFTLVISVERVVYWGSGEGATPEASAKKANSGAKLINDYSLAVDNSIILIGCKVTFSDDKKEREGVDVATSSKGINRSSTSPIIAIYFDTRDDAFAYVKKHPEKIVSATVKFPLSEGQKVIDAKKKYLEGIKNNIAEQDKKILELQKKLTGMV